MINRLMKINAIKCSPCGYLRFCCEIYVLEKVTFLKLSLITKFTTLCHSVNEIIVVCNECVKIKNHKNQD